MNDLVKPFLAGFGFAVGVFSAACMIYIFAKIIAILIDRRKKVLEQKDRNGKPTRFARRAAKRIEAKIGEILARGMGTV